MGDATGQDEGPSLELPSLFRRRKKQPAASDERADVPTDTGSDAAPDHAPATATATAPPLEEPVEEVVEEPASERADGETREVHTGATAVSADNEPTVVIAEPEPTREPEPTPEPVAEVEVEPEPEPEPDEVEATQVIPQPPAAERPGLRDRLSLRSRSALDDRPDDGPEPTPVGAAEPRRVRPIEPRTTTADESPSVPVRERVRAAVPDVSPAALAAVVGAIVGLLGCVVTWIGLQGCEVVTGAQTCGGPGLLILIAIVVGQILVGAALLAMVGVPEPGNLSFLGIGIAVVVTLLVLIDYLYEAWMFAAIPVVTALAFVIARWITTKYTDDGDDYPVEQRDIR